MIKYACFSKQNKSILLSLSWYICQITLTFRIVSQYRIPILKTRVHQISPHSYRILFWNYQSKWSYAHQMRLVFFQFDYEFKVLKFWVNLLKILLKPASFSSIKRISPLFLFLSHPKYKIIVARRYWWMGNK